MFKIYTKHRRFKRANSVGIITDSLERAKDIANREMKSWWGMNGILEWAKVKDTETGKYIYIATR